MLEETAKDYSKYFNVNLPETLKPINKSVDDMLARLEEFQTIVSIVNQERNESTDTINSVVEQFKDQLDDLCRRIDKADELMGHIKNNLDHLEEEIEKKEAELGCSETPISVSNIFTPLFKRSAERKPSSEAKEIFKTEDYFEQN